MGGAIEVPSNSDSTNSFVAADLSISNSAPSESPLLSTSSLSSTLSVSPGKSSSSDSNVVGRLVPLGRFVDISASSSIGESPLPTSPSSEPLPSTTSNWRLLGRFGDAPTSLGTKSYQKSFEAGIARIKMVITYFVVRNSNWRHCHYMLFAANLWPF